MKAAYCLNCEQDKRVKNWMPARCICHECMGSKKEGHYLRGWAPAWTQGGRGWTQERQDAYEASCTAGMVRAGFEAAFKREKAFMEAFMGAK